LSTIINGERRYLKKVPQVDIQNGDTNLQLVAGAGTPFAIQSGEIRFRKGQLTMAGGKVLVGRGVGCWAPTTRAGCVVRQAKQAEIRQWALEPCGDGYHIRLNMEGVTLFLGVSGEHPVLTDDPVVWFL
jgi:hypothetical protein